ncbi:hypothetical protein B0H19DRAFT_1061130 [Mycena capillaripes]|nr:hypothetical protein B0H19DRAFT_1061130 [Mycena capillaripes]
MRDFPQEMVDAALDCLEDDPIALRACATVTSSWRPTAQRHLFSTVTAESTTRTRNLRSMLATGQLGGYVQCIYATWPLYIPGNYSSPTDEEQFVYALIHLFEATNRAQELHLAASRLHGHNAYAGRLQRGTSYAALVASGRNSNGLNRTWLFRPPVIFLPLLETFIKKPSFRCLVLVNWDFDDTVTIPMVDLVPELRLVGCNIEPPHTQKMERFEEQSVRYQGVMTIGSLSFEGGSGWAALQTWIAKSLVAGRLALSGEDSWPLSKNHMWQRLQCIEITFDMYNGNAAEVAEIAPRLANLAVLGKVPCKFIAVYFEHLWEDEARTAVAGWLRSFQIGPEQLLRVHVAIRTWLGRCSVEVAEVGGEFMTACACREWMSYGKAVTAARGAFSCS